ncbi:MAG: helix-turn-helix domain-containing protein [Lachnospiraceae bacterium]|nr:helix-turn-helix domain-containing protein [Lachnospiraceae bacterium]
MQREKATFDILKKIDDERMKRNWSEYSLAKNADLTQSTISTWYRRNLQPSVASIEKICKGLGISLSEFFNDESSYMYLTPQQNEILELWEALTPTQRDSVINLLKSFLSEN